MKTLRLLPVCTLLVLLCSDFSVYAQLKYKITVLGKDDWPLYNAKIKARDAEFYTNNSGEATYTQKVYYYLTISAAGYMSQKINLKQYNPGTAVTVKLVYLGDEERDLNVFVKDKNGKQVTDAVVLVTPGISATTDAGGFAKVRHKQQPGEYIVVTVMKNGFKDQQQRVLVGVQQANAITRAVDVVRFTLEKGSNDRAVFEITVEVIDKDSDKPVKNATVQLTLSDGDSKSASTDNSGEALFRDVEFGFTGLTARVIVKHTDYEEKWSDITEDLMQAKDRNDRRFTVFISQKNKGITGEWKLVCCSGKYTGKVKLVQEGTKVTGTFYNTSNGSSGDVKGQVNGSSVTFVRDWGGGKQSYNLNLSGDGKKLSGNFDGDRDKTVGAEVTLTKM